MIKTKCRQKLFVIKKYDSLIENNYILSWPWNFWIILYHSLPTFFQLILLHDDRGYLDKCNFLKCI